MRKALFSLSKWSLIDSANILTWSSTLEEKPMKRHDSFPQRAPHVVRKGEKSNSYNRAQKEIHNKSLQERPFMQNE